MRQLPQTIESEKALLGYLLMDENGIYEVAESVSPDDFYRAVHRDVYQAVLSLYEKGQKIDLIAMGEKVNDMGLLTDLVNNACFKSGARDCVSRIKDKSIRRKLIAAQYENENLIYNEEIETDSLLAQVQNKVYSISPLKAKSDKIKDIIEEMGKLQDEYAAKYAAGQDLIGLSSGFPKIDRIIDGLRPGHIWTIGGWSGTGKTSFTLNILHSLLEQDAAATIITTEMSQIDLAAKLIGIRHDISSVKIIKGIHDEELAGLVAEGKEFLKNSDIEIHTEFDLDKMIFQIRKDFHLRKIKAALIDYAQKIISDKYKTQVQLLDNIAARLSNLAQELKITILLISQLSNLALSGQAAGAGFRGSGQLEACADLAMVLKRDKPSELPEAECVPVQVIVTKNKFGFDGKMNYLLTLKSGKFYEDQIS